VLVEIPPERRREKGRVRVKEGKKKKTLGKKRSINKRERGQGSGRWTKDEG